VNADAQLMEQVITNLLTNAMNYTPRGGSVHLSTAWRERDHAAWVTVAVADTGLGVSLEEQQHIFERFHRGVASQATGIPGTGLGLAICQEIVKLHQGHVILESQEGEGSIFTVWLPLG
jgi:signal transduction histidine kinase